MSKYTKEEHGEWLAKRYEYEWKAAAGISNFKKAIFLHGLELLKNGIDPLMVENKIEALMKIWQSDPRINYKKVIHVRKKRP